jgi:hypothetical protein
MIINVSLREYYSNISKTRYSPYSNESEYLRQLYDEPISLANIQYEHVRSVELNTVALAEKRWNDINILAGTSLTLLFGASVIFVIPSIIQTLEKQNTVILELTPDQAVLYFMIIGIALAYIISIIYLRKHLSDMNTMNNLTTNSAKHLEDTITALSYWESEYTKQFTTVQDSSSWTPILQED